MRLTQLLEGVGYDSVDFADVEISHLCVDSRKVENASLFFCIEGGKVDAHNFASMAVDAGAVALVVSHKIDADVPLIIVEDVRKALAVICSNFYDKVDRKMELIGVTGTNGKTTTTFILKAILETKYSVGVIGTSGCYIGDARLDTHLTTPDTLDLFGLFATMYEAGVTHIIMEVSAHAIALDKIYGLHFDLGIFTNLTHDHLDYFGDMESYWSVKRHFLVNYCQKIITNVDDECGRSLIGQGLTFSYGLDNPSDIFAVNIDMGLEGSDFFVNLDDEVRRVHFGLAGVHNVYNVMAGILAGGLYGVSLDEAVDAVGAIDRVDGRFEVVRVKDFFVVIDYAHSPDALEKILKSVKTFATRRLIAVFGACGYRDSLKRPEMGRVVSRYADYSVITSDNPRYENPMDIIRDIVRGYERGAYDIEPLRERAIKRALESAEAGDIVVICGKGRETSQNIMGVEVPYSDYDEVEKFCETSA